jgi:predicted O-methyltransferase YrrM
MRTARIILIVVALGACAIGCRGKLEGDEAYAAIAKILTKYDKVEGHTHAYPQRERCLKSLAARPDVNRMAEIGFNAGHSTVSLLSGNPGKTLTSFDLCTKAYYAETSSLMLNNYEGQLEIICGDSTQTLPELIEKGVPKYDFIHIDGGHSGDVPKQDILNSLQLSHPDTFILVDDCNRVQEAVGEGWIGRKVNQAWAEAERSGLIEPVFLGSCNIGNCLGQPSSRDLRKPPPRSSDDPK